MEPQFNSDPNYDVPDSTDWLNTPLSCLVPVEQAFRCHVCKDFYNSPMLTSCNHTFCSLCIRRCLSVDGKCPLCRKTDQESKLRGNWALREAVDSFKDCRATILDFARNPAPVLVVASPKRKASEVENSDNGEEPTPKRTRRSTRSTTAKGAEATTAMAQLEVDAPESEPADEYKPDDGLVACPICWERMKEREVDRHIATGSCPGTPSVWTLPASTRLPGETARSYTLSGAATKLSQPAIKPIQPEKPLEHLPALNYSMLKDQALRKKLADLRISSYGPRQLLEQRHKEWVTIWNANCDSAHPKSRAELLRDFDTWEKTLGTGTRTTAFYTAQPAQPQVKDKDFDGASWATSHNSSFKDLIAQARRTKSQAEQKAREASASEASAPQPGEPHHILPQASVPQPSVPQPSVPQPSYPQASVLQASLPQSSIPPASLPQFGIAQASVPEASVREPAPVVRESGGRDVRLSDSGSMGVLGRYHAEVYGFDGAVDFARRVGNDGPDQAQ